METMTVNYRGHEVRLRVYDYERDAYHSAARRMGAVCA